MRVVPEGQLVFGMQLPVQAQSEMFVADWERTAGPDELIGIVRKADETGFFYVGVCDHVAIPEDRTAAMGTTWYDTIATLGLIAGCTTRVRLLSHVWVPAYRHPLVSAKAFATLDHLSKGRVIIGVGAGHVVNEFASRGDVLRVVLRSDAEIRREIVEDVINLGIALPIHLPIRRHEPVGHADRYRYNDEKKRDRAGAWSSTA